MKIADYNKLRAAIYADAVKDPEVADALLYNDRVYLYDVTDSKQQHGVLALTAKTQLNDNTLADRGFDAATARTELIMTLDRKTKCATL